MNFHCVVETFKRKHFQLIEWFMRILFTKNSIWIECVNCVFKTKFLFFLLWQKVTKWNGIVLSINLTITFDEMYKFDSEFEIRCHLLEFVRERLDIKWKKSHEMENQKFIKIKRNKSLGVFIVRIMVHYT